MKVLVACEESQAVCIEFRKRGHEAYSCDILPCSGGHPEWHLQCDVLEILKLKWDMMIAFPPCTYMSNAGAVRMYPQSGVIDENRYAKAMEAKAFFMTLYNSDIPLIAIENPLPLKIIGLPKNTTYVQPFEFGEPYSKKTLLWLKGLPPLMPTNIISNYSPYIASNTGGKKRGQKYTYRNQTAKIRSKTFHGIAKAMAEQWG